MALIREVGSCRERAEAYLPGLLALRRSHHRNAQDRVNKLFN